MVDNQKGLPIIFPSYLTQNYLQICLWIGRSLMTGVVVSHACKDGLKTIMQIYSNFKIILHQIG